MANSIPSLYADGIGHIRFTDNLVRIDLVALQPQLLDNSEQAVYEITQRLVLPLEGFIEAFNIQEGLVQKLLQAGIARREEPLTQRGETE